MQHKSTIIVVIVVLLLGYVVFVKNPLNNNTTPFTDTNTPSNSAKLDMGVVCQSALVYTTFPDAATADKFVAECIEGKHPEVIERYKADMNLGDGAAI